MIDIQLTWKRINTASHAIAVMARDRSRLEDTVCVYVDSEMNFSRSIHPASIHFLIFKNQSDS